MVEGTIIYEIPLLLKLVMSLGMFWFCLALVRFSEADVEGSGWAGHQ